MLDVSASGVGLHIDSPLEVGDKLSIDTEVHGAHLVGEIVVVQSRIGAEVVQALLRELDGTTVGKVLTREPTLEDAYVELVQAQ